ncbi:hypothetical protein CCR75_001610 [Bremia lactucae]|uniref:CAP-Gly domain-containing protein n=1 Tax=Bremia lactucae TaxID=4779 RepID=A0A976FII8_BRELC|nr:hypothetical protein CCR75_001610 [Bremia lactucae]
MEVEVGARVAFGAGKTGIVRFIGETDFASGEWVGIELERPEGKNNGELNGRVYFTCAPNHGVFVKKSMVRAVLSATASTTNVPLARGPLNVDSGTVRHLSSVGTASLPTSELAAISGARLAGPRSRASIGSISSKASMFIPSVARSRLSLRGSTSRSSVASDDQLLEARTRISKLEEELEQKNRHVQQLNQSVAILKEAAAASGETIKGLEQQGLVHVDGIEQQIDQDETMPESMEVEERMTLSMQQKMAQQIESLRDEAEKRVRMVRAELEEHLAKVQASHDEQIDELRLQNSTKTSEIKTLEADVAQQKVRIATFTAAEQKKAEEVAMAVAKASSSARKIETLEKQWTECQDSIEMITLEKETIEMDKEIAEEHAEELQQEVEKLKAALALSSTAGQEVSDRVVGEAGDLMDENQKLRAAVKMLHERSSAEKAELSKKLRQAHRENAELVSLREEVEELTIKKSHLESETEELKEMLDLANAYESMVEDLTDKNLTLGEKLAEFETTVQSLESLREVDQEMEHQHTEYEAELRAEIDAQRISLQELKQTALDQKTVLEDKERTIARFRDLAHSHRDEIAQLKAKLRAEAGTVESLKDTAHVALNQTMGLRALVAAAREHETEAARQKINAEQAWLENSFLRAVVPSSIFSETDQKILRVRLTLGRIAGKSDILVQHLKKELEAIAHLPRSSGHRDEEKEDGAVFTATSVEHLVLGGKLAAVACQAKEDLFMLECHLTTEEEFADGCSALDTSQTAALESVLDLALSAFSEGALLRHETRGGGDGASLYDRLVQASEEWHSSRSTQVSCASNAASFGARSAVLKLRTRKSVAKLAFSISSIVTFLRTTKRLLASSEMPDNEQTTALRTELIPVLDQSLGELLSVFNLALSFYRRAEIDLAASDDDLDGLVAAGGEVVTCIQSYESEAQLLLTAVQTQLAPDCFVEHGRSARDLVEFTKQSVYDRAVAFKEKVALLYKLVCRGAFTDAVAPRTRSDHPDGANGRPQWRIRAQAIHQELVDASALRSNLTEMTDLCNALHKRIREFERADSQHRVVAQKLESRVLELTEKVAALTSKKAHLETQLAKEREQFDVALDESNKEKTLLSSLNRDLRKQLKRTSDASSSGKTGSSSNGSGNSKSSVLSAADAEAFHLAFHQLHKELHTLRSTLAKERLLQLFGPTSRRNAVSTPSNRLTNAIKEVATFSREVKAHLSMPRLVDLRRVGTGSTESSPYAQLMAEKLQQSRAQKDLVALRERVGAAMREDGWGHDIINAITKGECVFGWQPPEIERPPVLLGRVKFGNASTSTSQAVQLVLNRSEVKQLSQALIC